MTPNDASTVPGVYIVGQFEIDEACFELRERGALVAIEPKVLEFILYLIRHKARVVPKQELLDAVWKGACVVESVLTRCASLARRSLRDRGSIRTVYGRGYRWTGESCRLSQAINDRSVVSTTHSTRRQQRVRSE